MNVADGFPPLDPEIAAILSKWPNPDRPPTLQESRDSETAYFAEVVKWQKENAPAGMFPASTNCTPLSMLHLDSEYRVEDRTVPVDGGQNVARCLVPTPSNEDPTQMYPLMVWFHGGGIEVLVYYIFESLKDYYCRPLCGFHQYGRLLPEKIMRKISHCHSQCWIQVSPNFHI